MRSGEAVWIGSDGDADQVRKMLAPFKVPIKETTLAGTPLFIFKGYPPPERPLSGAGWSLTGDKGMVDGNRGILSGDRRLLLDPTQRPEGSDFLFLDMGSKKRISRIQLAFEAGFPPAQVSIEGSRDGQIWEGIGPSNWIGPLFWTGLELLKNSEKFWDVCFPPQRWRFIRIKPSP